MSKKCSLCDNEINDKMRLFCDECLDFDHRELTFTKRLEFIRDRFWRRAKEQKITKNKRRLLKNENS